MDNTGNGIETVFACTILNCATYNNGGDGINGGSTCTVMNCSVNTNSGNGIAVGSSCTVADCAVASNPLDGVRCVAGCVIRGNACKSNGSGATFGAGVHATGGDNRIEGNNCTSNDFGIDIDVAGSLIVRNSCANNTTNWVIAPNNIYGPIVDRTSPGSPAVASNSAAGTMGSTDPNANFSY